ncbi:MAG: hypothetical protein K2P52_08970 [Campylobacterales bacterium]|nr:hypothetical protein [Campylobacterales bacterium]
MILEDINQKDDLEALIYRIIDACPYDFEFIPTIASFKYLSYFDQINEFKNVRYFYKMYKLMDMLCVYKTLIQKYEELNSLNHNGSSTSQTSQLSIFCDDKHLFGSCQITAIKIYKEYFFTHKNTSINDNVLAHSLNHILNEFFEESYTSKLKEKDINRTVKVRTNFMGVEVWEFL